MNRLNPRTIAFALVMLVIAPVICSLDKAATINYLGQSPPGMTAELFAPGIVSGKLYEHSAPAFSPDGSVVLWTTMDRSFRASLFEMKFERGKWSGVHRPSFADSTADDYYPSFAPDGKKLYFSSRRKMPHGFPALRDMSIWVVERNGDAWGNPSPLDTTVSQGREYAHSISSKGTLYFSSQKGGATNFDIRRSAIVDGKYGKPELLPYDINSVGYEDGPYVAPDESFMIFESQRPESLEGSTDLYISFKSKDNRWCSAINMGPAINSAASERFARLSPDGRYLFFGSARNQSKDNFGHDIYWIDAGVIDELRAASVKSEIELPLGIQIMDALSGRETSRSGILLRDWLSKHRDNMDANIIYSSTLRKLGQFQDADQLLANTPSQWSGNPAVIMEKALVKLGLEKTEQANALLAPILTGDKLRERYLYLSSALLDMRKLTASDEYFAKGMAIGAGRIPYFARGCAMARLGETDRAFETLNKAVDLGHNSKADFEKAPDLRALRSDPRWNLLLDRLK